MTGWPSMSQTGLNGGAETPQFEVLPPQATPAPQKRTKLGNIREIRSELARVYRKVKSGEIDTTTGNRLTYILTQLANLTMDSQIEERLELLERNR